MIVVANVSMFNIKQKCDFTVRNGDKTSPINKISIESREDTHLSGKRYGYPIRFAKEKLIMGQCKSNKLFRATVRALGNE